MDLIGGLWYYDAILEYWLSGGYPKARKSPLMCLGVCGQKLGSDRSP